VQALLQHGGIDMAADFLFSGNKKLAEAAMEWRDLRPPRFDLSSMVDRNDRPRWGM